MALLAARCVRPGTGTADRETLEPATVAWLVAGLAALWLALGKEAGLWAIQSRLPLFSGIYHPMKYLPFVHLFAVTSGASIVDRFIGRSASKRNRRFAFAIATAAGVLSVWHAGTLTATFYSYAEKSYPSAENLPTVLRGQEVRIFPIAPTRSPDPQYTHSLTHNFACAAGVESAFGYAGFVRHGPEYRRFVDAFQNDPVAALRQYGVTHVVLHRTAVVPVRSGAPAARAAETESFFAHPKLRAWLCGASPVYADDEIAVYAVPKAAARADSHRKDGTTVAWTCRSVPNGVVVRPTTDWSGSEWLHVRYLYRPSFQPWCRGRRLRCEPSPEGTLRIGFPADYSGEPIFVCYRTPWLPGLMLSGLSALATCVSFVLPRIRRSRRQIGSS
ncbi:MAG: hypothetical protein D6741_06070 [Planctomycetota bacterium]|nr:MAG: hypothetical protein D6741_06070 [Planctomycetota bacterium]